MPPEKSYLPLAVRALKLAGDINRAISDTYFLDNISST